MRLGATTFVTDTSISPVELARELEARAFESLWLAEHTHIPISRRSPYREGEELPEMYRRSDDPVVALTAAAVATQRPLVGTAICLVAQRDPIVLGKQIACLDRLSGGRFVLGVGFGWNREEMENHGINPDERWALVREKIAAMRSLWRDDEAEYAGTLVHFERCWCWPKPISPCGPPVFLGGAGGPRMVRHVIDYADGWFPTTWVTMWTKSLADSTGRLRPMPVTPQQYGSWSPAQQIAPSSTRKRPAGANAYCYRCHRVPAMWFYRFSTGTQRPHKNGTR
jgi:probable F420-dependent oxidoreductase